MMRPAPDAEAPRKTVASRVRSDAKLETPECSVASISENRIAESLATEAEARAQAAQADAQRFGSLQTEVYQRVTLLVDDDPLLWLQFAQAAETAQQYDSAITAYEQFLELAPDDPNAEPVRERIELLRSFAGTAGEQDE